MNKAIKKRPSKQRIFTEWRYSIVLENLHLLEFGGYHIYGIQVITPDCINTLHDVSTCEETVKQIVDILNHYQVSPIHLCDVVMDMLP